MTAILIVLGFVLYLTALIIWDSIPEIEKQKNFMVITIDKDPETYQNDCFDRYCEILAFNDEESRQPVPISQQVIII